MVSGTGCITRRSRRAAQTGGFTIFAPRRARRGYPKIVNPPVRGETTPRRARVHAAAARRQLLLREQRAIIGSLLLALLLLRLL